ncbi:MAG: serine/threonine-protein kinase [Kofleriaceae bacterium]
MSEPEKFGTYLVYELLGKGGMATVHRAESLSAGGFRKRVALKRMLSHLLDDPEVTESFAREAKLASHLRHQNIAQTYDLGIRDGTYFIAMELVPGPTLRQVVRQCERAAGAMPIVHVLEILIQVCDALDYAHNLVDDHGVALGIVHRDVTPANIIVSSSGVVKLIDFGLAKVNASRATKAGIIKGKLSYMAPEYTLGRLDHRADLFAVGVIAHELLTGKRLFDHPNEYEIITMLREMPIQPPSRWNPSVTLALDDIVMTALSRDPGLRWQSAGAMRAALVNLAREVQMAPGREGLAKWTEWAFTQAVRKDVSGLSEVIQMLGDPSDQRPVTIEPDELLTPTPSPITRRHARGGEPDPTPATVVAAVAPAKRGAVAAGRRSPQDTDGVVVGRSVLPVAPRRSAWPRVGFVVVLVLVVAGAAAYWYLFLRQ